MYLRISVKHLTRRPSLDKKRAFNLVALMKALPKILRFYTIDQLYMVTVNNLASSGKYLVLSKGIASTEYVFSFKTKFEPLLSLARSRDDKRVQP